MRKGFTLVEMLIVIVIIGILATALIPKVIGIQARARDISRVKNIDEISNALQVYYYDNGNYPQEISNDPGGRERSDSNVWLDRLNNYMKNIPKDPKNTFPYLYYYYNYDNMGWGACPNNAGDNVIVAAKKFEAINTINETLSAICPGRDWGTEFEYAKRVLNGGEHK